VTYTTKKVIHGKEVSSSFDSNTRVFSIECDGECGEVYISKEDRNRRWELTQIAVNELCEKLDRLKERITQ
jgi:hypothetical protein